MAYGVARPAAVSKRILVVEDDLELVELLELNLTQAGYAVCTANDGSQALSKAWLVLPDLILLDLMLPELDGFAVCEILKRDHRTAGIPIFILSAMSSHLARLAGLGAGASDYLCKPFSTKNLLARIHAFLGTGSGLAQQLARGPQPRPRAGEADET